MLGYITQDEVARLLQALASRDGKQLFTELATLQQRAPDYHQVLAELITGLHQAAVFQVVPEQQPSDLIKELAQQFSAEELQLYYQIALLGQKDLPFMPTPAQGFEMIMLRMLAFKPVTASTERTATLAQAKQKEKAPLPLSATAELKTEAVKTAVSLSPEWRELLPKLGLTGVAYALALNCRMETMTEQQVTLVLGASYKPMMNPKLVERIEQALGRYFNKPLRVTIRITEDEVHSPAKQQEQEEKVRRASALESLQQGSTVQKIKTLFNATLDTQSVEVGE